MSAESKQIAMNILNLKRIIFIIFFNCIYLNLAANNQLKSTISGIILDKDSRLPVSEVNVFLANTTIGDASDNMGEFKIENVPEGFYDLIFDRVGYKTKSIQVKIIQPQLFSYSIELDPKIYSTEIIQIIGDQPEHWLEQLEIFTREFIGYGRNAKECAILNTEVLEFRNDSITRNLIASSDSILKIRNNALGYQIDVRLVQFEYDSKNNSCIYEIYPRFREILPDNSEQLSQWIDNRQKIFRGSLRHFLYLLNRDAFFPIYKLYILNSIREKVNVTRDILNCENVPYSSLIKISFYNFVGIDYYYFNAPQESRMLRLNQGYAFIDTLGNIYGQITKQGAWSKERLADLLPYDYKPNKKRN